VATARGSDRDADFSPRPFGKYELLERIGAGGMAEIYRARQTGPDGFEKQLVLKTILPQHADDRAFINMLIAEAKVTSLLQHPNIVQIYELGEIAGQHYIAMEYVEGSDLLELLARCTRFKLRVPTELTLYLVSEVCKGLAAAHAAVDSVGRPLHIVHRDVSPSNILVSVAGDVKIMDFGVASMDLGRGGGVPGVADFKGKVGYLSPEQVVGQPIDRRSDIFALGVILFECLTLKRLFVGRTDAQTLTNIRDADIERKFKRHSYIPPAIRVILRRALARDPRYRYQTATDFQEAVLDYLFENRLRVNSRRLAAFLRQVLYPSVFRQEKTPPPRAAAPHSGAPLDDPGPARGEGAPHPETGDADADPDPGAAGIPLIPELPQDALARLRLPRDLRRVDLTRATFHFRHDGEAVFGPLDFDRMTQLLRARCIGPREWVSINGSDWLRTHEVPALIDLHPAAFEDEPDRPFLDGPLNLWRTPNLLHQVQSGGLAGMLKLTRGTMHKSIYFDRGRALHASSNQKSELLGMLLIRAQIASPEQVDAGLAHAAEHRVPLGQALVALGALSAEQRDSVLATQRRERILDAFRWTTGWYEFFAGVLPPAALVLPPDDDLSLAVSGIRERYDLRTLREILAEHRVLPIVAPPDLAARTADLGLSGEEHAIRDRIRTTATIDALLEPHRDDDLAELALFRVVFALHQTDHLAFRAR